MRIAVLGTGAMGSVYAGLLASAGFDVWAVDTWTDHVDAMRRNGLRVSGASGERTAQLKATTDAREVGRADLVIIATKARDVEAAATSARAILSDEGVVLTIQNGLGSTDRVAGIVGAERLMIGVVGGFGASMTGPGHVHHKGMEFVRLGEHAGGLTPRLEQVGKVWEKGGFRVLLFEDIQKMVWEKFICNVAYSGVCAVTGMTVGEVMADPHASSISAACATEAFKIARAKGIAVDIEEPVAYVRNFGTKVSTSKPSMLLDHLAQRPSEVDVINGAVSRVGAEVGIAAPVNDVVAAIVRAKETLFPPQAR